MHKNREISCTSCPLQRLTQDPAPLGFNAAAVLQCTRTLGGERTRRSFRTAVTFSNLVKNQPPRQAFVIGTGLSETTPSSYGVSLGLWAIMTSVQVVELHLSSEDTRGNESVPDSVPRPRVPHATQQGWSRTDRTRFFVRRAQWRNRACEHEGLVLGAYNHPHCIGSFFGTRLPTANLSRL